MGETGKGRQSQRPRLLILASIVVFLFAVVAACYYAYQYLFVGTFGPNPYHLCVPYSGYACLNYTLSHDISAGTPGTLAQLDIALGQHTGVNMYNLTISASSINSSTTQSGFPLRRAVATRIAELDNGDTGTATLYLKKEDGISSNVILPFLPIPRYCGYLWANYSTIGPDYPATNFTKIATICVGLT